jgi:hypothetical protein
MTLKNYYDLSQNPGRYSKFIIKHIKNDDTGAECYFFKDVSSEKYTLMFCGTQNILDALMDSLFFKTNHEKGYPIEVHTGFNLQYQSIKKEIEDFIYQNNVIDLHVVGHSLGSALGTLFLLDNIKKYYSGIFFGCPNVFNKYGKIFFDIFFSKTVVYYKNVNDIITYLPFKFMDYYTGSNIIKLGKFNLFKMLNLNKEHHNYNIKE